MMRNVTSGAVGLALGGLIVLGSILSIVRGGPQGDGAYRAGQITGLVFGLLLLGVGIFYLVKGVRETRQPPPKKKRRKRRLRQD